MFKVEISEDTREFILNRAEAVYVDAMMTCSGCIGLTMVPVVNEGEPPEPENYELVVVDGIKVYILKGAVIAPDGIRIFLEGNKFVYQELEVEGLRYPA
ncbi:CC/Se motif family (seleno)protein [Pelotomaculum propionicicum]|uniref:CC/Se motif family (seleno)protein n=1 Tax=Pelotomaculum propionicicum TaxID=258475 RepID=UPI003B81326C